MNHNDKQELGNAMFKPETAATPLTPTRGDR